MLVNNLQRLTISKQLIIYHKTALLMTADSYSERLKYDILFSLLLALNF